MNMNSGVRSEGGKKKRGSSSSALHVVEKAIVDELLLVCGVIGSTTDGGKIVPVTDCLEWLQDLQRVLRRDDDVYRPISLLLGQWRIVETKLLPLLLECKYDTSLVLTICKILVLLTKPLHIRTQHATTWNVQTKQTSPA